MHDKSLVLDRGIPLSQCAALLFCESCGFFGWPQIAHPDECLFNRSLVFSLLRTVFDEICMTGGKSSCGRERVFVEERENVARPPLFPKLLCFDLMYLSTYIHNPMFNSGESCTAPFPQKGNSGEKRPGSIRFEPSYREIKY